MLVLSRRSGERVIIADVVELTIIEVRGERVKLGFKAPHHISIQREEVVRRPSAESSPDGETPPTEKPEKSNVKVDASATASATAFGIDAEGEQHDTSRTLSLEITGSGLTASIEDSATALAGADTVTNDGAVVSTAIATSRAASAGLAIDAQGSAEVAADSTADAKAVGVFTGGGADSVTNNGALTANAAAAAGADSITVLPYTAAIGLPDSSARRIARNTQLVLQQESSLSRVIDPAGGSWAIESLTDAMAGEAWSLFELELEELYGTPSDYYDGLSFGQSAQLRRPFISDRFDLNETLNEPHDELRFREGSVEPGDRVTLTFVVTDATPIPEFYLLQRPSRLISARPTWLARR